jgi:folate-dependent phosphoribosylglycinamide formyltransferase PurN
MSDRVTTSPSPGGTVLLTTESELSAILIDGLTRRLGNLTVVYETAESKATILKRRMRRCGLLSAAGQLAFGVMARLPDPRAKQRLAAIKQRYGLNASVPDGLTVHRVASVNADETRALLQRLAPTVVAVYGTRIISTKTLGCTTAPFINYHAGITPQYRGQHPAYWALVNRDAQHAGVTVHLVDKGVDTGMVLYQAPVAFERGDWIGSYMHVQMATAMPLFARAIDDAIKGTLAPRAVSGPSQHWYPPTIWSYAWNGLTRAVW